MISWDLKKKQKLKKILIYNYIKSKNLKKKK